MKDGVALRWHGRARKRAMLAQGGARLVVIDVDGCLTDGKLYFDSLGMKPFKAFGLDDHAAIKQAIAAALPVHLITSDWQQSTVRRAAHMKVPITHAPAEPDQRLAIIDEIRHSAPLPGIVYIGDGYHDADVMQGVGFGIAPGDSWPATLRRADAVTSRQGGKRSVAQALDFVRTHLMV